VTLENIAHLRADVAVIGAGPAGMSAAIELTTAGVDTLTVDEASAPGGRIWRAPSPALRDPGDETDLSGGAGLRARATHSGARVLQRAVVWSVGREGPGWRIDALTPQGSARVSARILLVAIGTVERVIPFPGWTLPGVVSLAGTTLLLKSQHMSPGSNVVVAGSGPLLAAVSAGLLESGARVAALADIAARRDWLRAAPALISRPKLAARGAGWVLRNLTAGVAPKFRTGVYSAAGDGRVEEVVLGPVGADGAPVPDSPGHRVACDALVVGHGLSPATEITRLLRAEHVFDRDLGGWRPVTDEAGRTSIPGLFVAGDGAGVRGADAACVAGRWAAQAIKAELKGTPKATGPRGTNHATRLGDAMSYLTRQRPAMTGAISPDTVICRCEDVTRGEIDAAIADGASDINQLKHFTRCGMGPCQGRSCGDVAGELIALNLVKTGRAGDMDAARHRVGQWTGRTPLRPIPVADLVGTFSYDDIPVPEPAPL
jgi:thioredoxin reductase/bacterioferritin-associated ferredoxin